MVNNLFKTIGYYAIMNAGFAVLGLLIILFVAGSVDEDVFGNFATYIAMQNAWAMIAFFRIDSRIANCDTENKADQIFWAGFLFGAILSSILALLLFTLRITWLNFPLVIISGFALAVLDAKLLRLSYSGSHVEVAKYRFLRIVAPSLSLALPLLIGMTLEKSILLSTIILLLSTICIFLSSQRPKRLYTNMLTIINEYKKGLAPASSLSIVNAIWINGLTPLINIVVSPVTAGQFALFHRILTGGFGLVGQAVYMALNLNSTRVDFRWENYKRVMIYCFLFSIIVSVLFYFLFLFLSSLDTFSFPSVDLALYVSVSLFSIASFSVGSISILAIRLSDEWFLLIWQIAALMMWGVAYIVCEGVFFLNLVLCIGAFMYIVLIVRWRQISVKNELI